MSFSGDMCIVVLTQAKFHHTIEEQNKTDMAKKLYSIEICIVM